MNLVLIYGPPASGKLTVAQELAKQTGYKLFHNHLTQDLAGELYPTFDETRFGLVDSLRLVTFAYAAQHDTDLIFTFVYSGGESDDQFVTNVIAAVTSNGGKVFFVQLDAPDDVLLERVGSDSRQQFRKLKDATILRSKLEQGAYRASVRGNDTYKLDSSRVEPTEAARSIIAHFKLRQS